MSRRVLALVGAALLIAAADARAETVITQKDKQFSAETVSVKNGEKIRFVNDDSVTHNISVKDPAGAAKPGIVQKPGEQSDVAFDKAGEYNVHCLIHPKMKLTVKAE